MQSRCRSGRGAVRFEHVTFGYDPAKPVLHDITFDAPGGSIVAIVGPTGAGKSTLVSLIARFYDPQQGRISHRRRRSPRRESHAVCERKSPSSFRRRISSAIPLPATSPMAVRISARAISKPPPVWRRRTNSSRICPQGYQAMLGERGSVPLRRATPAAGDRPRHSDQSARADPR